MPGPWIMTLMPVYINRSLRAGIRKALVLRDHIVINNRKRPICIGGHTAQAQDEDGSNGEETRRKGASVKKPKILSHWVLTQTGQL
jgi:hypothetical protein